MQSIKYSDIVIAGDFNSNVLVERKLTDPMKTIGLTPANSVTPTFFTSTSNTLLDDIFVSNRQKMLHYEQLSAPTFSKHDLIFLNYNIQPVMSKQTFTFRDFNNINIHALQRDTQIVRWEQIYTTPNIDDQLQFLQGNILLLYIINMF